MKGNTDGKNYQLLLDNKPTLPLELDMVRVLGQQPDFMAEKCALQLMIEKRGHIFLKSPPCHPELAGQGIEYCWGYTSTVFRTINDCTAAHLESNVAKALSKEYLTMSRVWKYQRRTRDYMRMYIQLANKISVDGAVKESINQVMLEKSRKDLKKTRTLPSAAFLRHAGRIYTTHA